MGLYDFLLKYNLDYETLVEMVHNLRGFVWIDSENTIRDLDCIYNDEEFKKLKKATICK